MEFTVWEESQRHNATNFVDPWDNDRPFDPEDVAASYNDLDPRDAGSPPTKLADEFDDFHRDAGGRRYDLDDPSMHIPSGLSRADFVGPADLQSGREGTAFDDADAEPAGRGHKRELSEAFTMRYPLVSPSHGDSYGHTAVVGIDRSPDLSASMMRTPIRDFSGYQFDHMRVHDSPSYAGAGLESPLESLALQSPYMAGQPFPALPRVSEHQASPDQLEHRPTYPSDSPRPPPQRRQVQQRQLQHQDRSQQQHQHDREQQQQQYHQQHHDFLEKSHNEHHSLSSDSPTSLSKPASTSDDATAAAAAAAAAGAGAATSPSNPNPSDRAPRPAPRSSSGSLSKNLPTSSGPQSTPTSEEPPKSTSSNAATVENTPERGPTTPRASASAKFKPKSRRTPSTVTPRASGNDGAPSSTPTPNQDGRRDSRKRIAKEQIEILEAFFHKNPRPEREDRMRLSSETNLEPRTVQIWFQNRRAKSRSLKMPPSQADNSLFAQQYRAAAAAASNAAAAAAGGQHMMGPVGPHAQYPMDRTPTHGGDPWSLTPGQQQRMLASPAGPRPGPGYGVFQPQQRVYTGHGSPPPHAPGMTRYHQQLAGKQMYAGGSQGMQAMPPSTMQYHNSMQPMSSMHQMPMGPGQGSGSPLMPAMQPAPMGHGRSMSAYEPFVAGGYGPGPTEYDPEVNLDSMMYASKAGSSASLASMGSSYGLPQSPLSSELVMEGPPPVYSPSMQSVQNSPEMNSPMASFPTLTHGRAHSMSEEPVPLSRSQSAHSFGDAWSRATPMGEVKRRRSLYGAVPTWGWIDPNTGTYVHTSPPRTPSMSSTTSSSGSTGGGTLAASAAAAALRTRNRSSTQPAPRSRQPSIRLQLDESNHSATLVVLPQEEDPARSNGGATTEPSKDGRQNMTPRSSSERLSSREMSPERAERAAERLLAERAAAATVGGRPSSRQPDN